MEEFLKCRDDFLYFAKTYLKVRHPKRGIVPFEVYPFQERLAKSFEQHNYVILKKFRQGGFTTFSVFWLLWRCIFHENQKIFIASKTGREAIHIGKLVNLALNYFPDVSFKPVLKTNNQYSKKFAFTNSSIGFGPIEAVRSRSLTHLFIDDASFIKNMDQHWRAVHPTLSGGSKCFVASVVNGADGWFFKTYQDALSKKNAFYVFDSFYLEHPDFNNPTWTLEMQKGLGERGFKQEVLAEFLVSDVVAEERDEIEYANDMTSNQICDSLKSIAFSMRSKKKFDKYAILIEAVKRLGGL